MTLEKEEGEGQEDENEADLERREGRRHLVGPGCIKPEFFFSSPSSSSAQILIYVRARAEPSSEIPLPSEPEPSSARISHLLSSPSRAWLGF